MCGALGREVKEIVDRRGWDVDIYGVSALLHLYPSRIVDELREASESFRHHWDLYRLLFANAPADLAENEPDGYDHASRQAG